MQRTLTRTRKQLVRERAQHIQRIQNLAELLTTIPGVSDIVANVILSEIGVDMSRFPTSGHRTSWAGLCPRNDESAGKRRSTRVRTGAPWRIAASYSEEENGYLVMASGEV
jgi:transposase